MVPSQNGIWDRKPIYAHTAAIAGEMYIYTGSLDLQNRPQEALSVKTECDKIQKQNCRVTIVPGEGRGFSPPRPPRSHPYLDLTIGRISNSFLETLGALATSIGS